MTTLNRWLRFNLVGALGVPVQLTALAVFHRYIPGHPLYASAAAIELTLLHNFLWHNRFTWPGQQGPAVRHQLIRFHLSNGVISMLGNLTLTHVFLRYTRLPLLLINLIAILTCSLVNFVLSQHWVFAPGARTPQQPRHRCAAITLAILCGIVSSQAAHAQNAQTQTSSRLDTDCAYANVFLGLAATPGGSATRVTFTSGVTFGQYFARPLGQGITGSPQFELGLIGPLPGGHPIDGLASVDYMFANQLPRRHIYPFVTVGYTRLFATGNAANFGFGMDFGRNEYTHLLRIELRDYYLFTGPQQHIVGIRIGLGKFIGD